MSRSSQHLDLRGLRCPLPVIKLEKAMRQMQPGDEITLEADDPLAKIDLPHAAAQAGFLSEDMGQAENGTFRFRIAAPKSGKDVPRDWAED